MRGQDNNTTKYFLEIELKCKSAMHLFNVYWQLSQYMCKAWQSISSLTFTYDMITRNNYLN